jgi:hypothetical protein
MVSSGGSPEQKDPFQQDDVDVIKLIAVGPIGSGGFLGEVRPPFLEKSTNRLVGCGHVLLPAL